jgi:small subunit ribosomal protein S2
VASATTMRQLLEAGVHFGHQTRRWNPHMRPFIFGERNGIHILDLAQTVPRLDAALEKVREVAAAGDKVLFVGTKKQARGIIEQEAEKIGMPYVNNRWLGGTLTNFSTIAKRIKYFNELSERFEDSEAIELEDSSGSLRQTKRERLMLQKEYGRLTRAFSGLRSLERPPGAVFIVDPAMEDIAVREANRARIPIIAMCDTNANPDVIDFPVPSNDDAIRAIQLMTGLVATAIREGVAVGEVEQQFQQASAATEGGEEDPGAAANPAVAAPAAAAAPAAPAAATEAKPAAE